MISFFKKSTREHVTTDSLEQNHQLILKDSTNSAKRLAILNKPERNDSMNAYDAPIRARYMQIYQKERSHVQDTEMIAKNTLAQKQSEQNQRARLTTRKAELNLLKSEEAEDPNTDTEIRKGGWSIHIVIIAIAVFEAKITQAAFSLFVSSNNFEQIGNVVFLTIAFAALPHLIVKLIRATETNPHKWYIRIAAAIMLIGCYAAFAVIRSMYVKNIGGLSLNEVEVGSVLPLKPYHFIAIQVFLLAIAVYLATCLPTDRDRTREKRSLRIEQLEKIIERMEDELQNIPSRTYQSEVTRQEEQLVEEKLKARLQEMFRESWALFVSENITHRNDGVHPLCFNDIPQSLF